jgi:hypothetical protein
MRRTKSTKSARPHKPGVIGWKPEETKKTMRFPLSRTGIQIVDDSDREVVSSSTSRFEEAEDLRNLDQIVNGMNLLARLAVELPSGVLRDEVRKVIE